jgi:hypothetical protein
MTPFEWIMTIFAYLALGRYLVGSPKDVPTGAIVLMIIFWPVVMLMGFLLWSDP